MKLILGLVSGAVLMWLYGAVRARGQARSPSESAAPQWFKQAGQAAVSSARDGVQRVSELIDAAPVPDAVKSNASNIAFNAWAATDALAEKPTETDSPGTTESGPAAKSPPGS